MKEAMFYEKLKNKKTKCNLCARTCTITEANFGFCRVRKNIKGKLYSLNYGKIASMGIDPIEKKPFFHFAPGSKTLSITTVGCNFRCDYCCNYELSQEWEEIYGEEQSPKQIVDLAIEYNCQGISYTYTEPTIFFEFAYDTAKKAKKKGLYNCFVTNGYTTPKPIKKISKYLDAAVIDFKASANPEFYKRFIKVPDVMPIYEALKTYKKHGVFLEITNLIVPKFGENLKDVKKLCNWIVNNIGPDTPMHFIRFFPSYKLDLPQTDIKILEKVCNIAKKQGLKYIYLGNVVGHEYENSFCECGELLIKRLGIQLFKYKRKCLKCGKDMLIKGKKWEGLNQINNK